MSDDLAHRLDVEEIEVERDAHVTIRFGDGVTARFGVGELRLACPCADCQGKRQREQSVQPAVERGEPISITSVELSGAFGLNLDWSDGHRTGIYAWSLFRDGLDAGRLGTRL
jgi:Uncharacterized protein conserved in bacteria